MAKETDEIPETDLPTEMLLPFGGLLKDTIYNRVLVFIAADPYSDYRVKDMVDVVKGNRSKVGDALRDLERQGLLSNISPDKRHPLYRPRLDSLRLQALVFLAESVVDDRDGTSLMRASVEDFLQDMNEGQEPHRNAETSGAKASGRTVAAARS